MSTHDGERESAVSVLVAEADPVVGRWRARYDPSAAAGVPAHVTLLYPFLAPTAIDDVVVRTLSEVIGRFSPFPVRLARAERFPDGLLYLAPEPARPFALMTAAIWRHWPEAPPYRGEHPQPTPHLTVAHADHDGGADEAEAAVAASLPIDSMVRSAWLLEQDDDGHWRRRAELALSGARR